MTYIHTRIAWLAPQESPVLPMATKCLASSCLQPGLNARVILKSKNKKSICKVRSKRCERGESSNNIPPIHTGASPGRQGAPAVPIPRLGRVPPNSYFWWMHMARQEPFQTLGWMWGLSSAPRAQSPQAHLTGNRHLRLWVVRLYGLPYHTSKAFSITMSLVRYLQCLCLLM